MADVTTSESAGKLERKLSNVVSLFIPFASRAVGLSLQVIKGIWSIYPPQPPRDRAKSFNTYVRGVGQFPRSAFIQDEKKAGGFRVKKTAASRIRLISEKMNTRFREQVTEGQKEVIGAISNDASYAAYVIGPTAGEQHQTPFHHESGWVTTDEALSRAMPDIERIQDEAIEAFIGEIR